MCYSLLQDIITFTIYAADNVEPDKKVLISTLFQSLETLYPPSKAETSVNVSQCHVEKVGVPSKAETSVNVSQCHVEKVGVVGSQDHAEFYFYPNLSDL